MILRNNIERYWNAVSHLACIKGDAMSNIRFLYFGTVNILKIAGKIQKQKQNS